jgi:O-antigen/teichoic acid export membrane protein
MITRTPRSIDSSSLNLVARTRYNVYAKVIAAVTSLVVNGYSTRILGVDLFGRSQYILWIVQTVWLAGNLGLPQMYTRFLALDAKTYSHRLLFHGKTVWILFLPVFLAAFAFYFVDDSLRVLVACLMVGVSIQFLLQSISDGFMHNDFHFYATIGSSMAMLCTAYYAVPQMGIPGYVLALLLQSVVYGCMMIVQLSRKILPGTYSQNTREETASIFHYTAYAWMAAVLSAFIWQRMELYFINRYLTNTDVSYYSTGLTFSLFIMQPVVMLSSSLTSHFSKGSRDDHARTQQTYVFLTKTFAWSTFLLAWFVAFNSNFFLSIIYGDKFAEGSFVAFWLLAFSPLSAIASVGSSLVYGYGKTRFIALSSLSGALLAPWMYMLVVPEYGIVGTAIARGILQALFIAAGSFYITKFMHFSFPVRSYLYCMVAAAVTSASVQWLFPQQYFMYIMIKGLFVMGIYILITNNHFVFSAQERVKVVSTIKSVFS